MVVHVVAETGHPMSWRRIEAVGGELQSRRLRRLCQDSSAFSKREQQFSYLLLVGVSAVVDGGECERTRAWGGRSCGTMWGRGDVARRWKGKKEREFGEEGQLVVETLVRATGGRGGSQAWREFGGL
ncbi:hypothetical protein GOBAR_AA35864 [Gossypium barbadense]|uniref:Uncharacterized protein n=1 Tax=Gossypium barbadense TaxID=3634 RepID=A0A2P5W174_GOSBA|nr:hypothetical protein GOBAR_AA35864 [Gossypium barbadense]